MKKITVLVADDHTIVRQGLKHLIEMSEDIEVIGEADNGEAVLKEAKRLLPNVILMDIAMPKANGIESARRIAKEVPVAKILMLSTYHDDQEVHLAIAAGATGYLMKETAGADLLRAIRETHKGNAFFSPEISRQVGEARAEWKILRDLAVASCPDRAPLLGCETGWKMRQEIARVIPSYEGIQNLRRLGDVATHPAPDARSFSERRRTEVRQSDADRAGNPGFAADLRRQVQ